MEDLDAWLAAQPLDTVVDIAGEYVYLNRHEGGAVLGAYLYDAFRPDQLQAALQHGFSSSLNYEAGLGLSDDGNGLVLSVWLAGVESWAQAATALEDLLNQLAAWRELLAPPAPPPGPTGSDRNERRLRALFAKA